MINTATSMYTTAASGSGFRSIHDFFKAIQLLLMADRIESAEQMRMR